MGWKPEGCYKEHKLPNKRALQEKYYTVNKVNKNAPDRIEQIFMKCKEQAEKNGYEIFGIRVSITHAQCKCSFFLSFFNFSSSRYSFTSQIFVKQIVNLTFYMHEQPAMSSFFGKLRNRSLLIDILFNPT